MRNVEAPARFQNRQPARNANRASVRIREPDEPATTLEQRTRSARDEYERNRRGPRGERVIADLGESLELRLGADLAGER
jgi:hypothetical protein